MIGWGPLARPRQEGTPLPQTTLRLPDWWSVQHVHIRPSCLPFLFPTTRCVRLLPPQLFPQFQSVVLSVSLFSLRNKHYYTTLIYPTIVIVLHYLLFLLLLLLLLLLHLVSLF